MIKIGITGHRDLDDKSIYKYKQNIYDKLIELKKQHSNITLYSALADGADRLVVYEAIHLNINFIVVLPMEKKLYKNDFNDDSKKEFEDLIKLTEQIIIISTNKENKKSIYYEKAGRYISDNCDILFALWDGTYNNLIGGTSEIVKYHKINNKELYHINVNRFN